MILTTARRMDRMATGRQALVLLMLLAATAGGCGKPPGVIFPPLDKPLLWPAAPETPRIKYVGQLATSADLKPRITFTQSLGRSIFGQKPAFSMLTPYALCTDYRDRLFVADSNAQVVHVFNFITRKYERWTPAAPERFTQPVGIAWDPAGRLFVADSVAGRIFVFNKDGSPRCDIGRDFVTRPCGLAYDAARNRLFVADAAAHRVIVLAPNGTQLARMGTRGSALGEFNYPTNVTVDREGRLYVSDSLNFRIQQFDVDLKPLRQIGRKGDMPGYFAQPKGVACDSQNHLYIVDANFESVQIFNASGELLLAFGEEGRKPGEFWIPAGLFIDSRDRIWVADSYNRRVQVFDYLAEGRP